MRKILKANGTGEAVDRQASDRGETRIGRGGIGAAVNHGVRNFNARGESVENDAPGLLLEDGYEFAIGREKYQKLLLRGDTRVFGPKISSAKPSSPSLRIGSFRNS